MCAQLDNVLMLKVFRRPSVLSNLSTSGLRRLGTVFAIALLGMTAVSQSSVAASVSASMTTEEQEFAELVATTRPWLQPRNALTQNEHSLGVQTLSIEMDERKKNKHLRRARVYQFNYNTQQSRLILIDLDSRQLAATKRIDSVHLPLNEQEIAAARAMVEQDGDIMAALNLEQQSRHLAPLSDLSTVDVKASIFEPADSTHVCAIERCALLSLFDQSRTVFSEEPLVNLQRLTVSTLQQSL